MSPATAYDVCCRLGLGLRFVPFLFKYANLPSLEVVELGH